jgi:hypothetical protein
MGGAVDLARHARYKAELANAVDSAALALGRKGEDMDEEEAEEFVQDYVAAFTIADDQFEVDAFDVEKTSNGFIVTAEASMKTMFLPLGDQASKGHGINSMDVNITAEVVHSSNRLELALVLDNTGSMNCGAVVSGSCTGDWSSPSSSSRIVALKSAAHTLINTLMKPENDPNLIKIGVVPFEGTVNIGSTYAANPPSWVDWNDQAKAKFNGVNFGKWNFSSNAACTSGANCKRVGHKWLYGKLTAKDSNVKWAGCVEMRAEPYDILDTTPTSATPDTLFVPFFWPDEADSNNDDNDNYQNNYLNDKISTSEDPAKAQKDLTKYTSSSLAWQSSQKDTSFPYESGPNYGCPRPITPLTSTKSTIDAAIDDMVAYPAMGTFIPVGLVWGWHVLSPTAPFIEGAKPGDQYYDQTVKAIVLLSDGENSVTSSGNHNKSIFSAYNYTGAKDWPNGGTTDIKRLGSTNADTATNNMDARTASLCTNVKNAGIRLYTITFGSIPTSAQTLMRNCASVDEGETLYYHAPSNAELQDVFRRIGEDLSEVHLAM